MPAVSMSLAPGTRLGPYEIAAQIGAGGMGEVYRARDERLGRDVAIKVLPQTFSTDPDRLRRFEQEARATAALNHPNILAVYDIGLHDDAPYVACELLEGETLREALSPGALPIKDAIAYAVQTCQGLAAAHERGLVHRDLKPENLFITRDGRVKILDFGLAKLVERSSGPVELTVLPAAKAGTAAGLVLGTIGYMSPEQVRGQPVDHRSDIFAFGAVLYEMLSGRRAFQGDTTADTMTAILKDQPAPLRVAHAHIPPGLERIVERCLEKNPAARFKSADDLAFALQGQSSASEHATVFVPARRMSAGRLAVAAAALAVAATAVAAVAFWTRGPSDTAPVASKRLAIVPPPGIRLVSSNSIRPAISPDGATVIFAGTHPNSNQQLFRYSMREGEAQAVPGTVGATRVFFSPDGRWIAFVRANRLQKVSVDGGPPTDVAELALKQGAWGPNDTIVFGASLNAGLTQVSATGGTPTLLTKLGPGEIDHRMPTFLANGKAVIFTVVTEAGVSGAQIAVQSLESGERHMLLPGSSPQLVSTGHLLFVRGGSLWAVPFDSDTLQIRGTPVRVVEDVRTDGIGLGFFSAASDGTLVYLSGAEMDRPARLVFRSRDGRGNAPVVPEALDYPRYPRMSPDGHRLALTLGPSNQGDIWVYDTSGARQPLKLTFDGHDTFPIWTPDGATIVFASSQLWSVAADGSARRPVPIKLPTTLTAINPSDFAPDGALMFSAVRAKTGRDLFLMKLNGSDEPREWLSTDFDEDEARLSPDGRFVAYVSNETGESQVWVRPFPGPGAPIRVSSGGGHEPLWSGDGKELFFQSGATLMVARVVSTLPEFRVTPPEQMFTGGFVVYAPTLPRNQDIAPDGRFLMVEQTEATRDPSHIVVVTNWFDELKRLVPTN